MKFLPRALAVLIAASAMMFSLAETLHCDSGEDCAPQCSCLCHHALTVAASEPAGAPSHDVGTGRAPPADLSHHGRTASADIFRPPIAS
jgi:hypothetical protein